LASISSEEIFFGANSGEYKFCPHLPQNLKSGGFAKLQFEQIPSKLAPHCPQNVKPSGFSVEHFGHFIIGLSFNTDPLMHF
jgi:hypothetical protein